MKLGLIIFLTLLALPTSSLASPEIMGYFDTELSTTNTVSQPTPLFDQHRLSLMFQHEVEDFKFFTEVEYQHGPEVSSASQTGEIAVERAWADISLNPTLGALRLGKMEEPTLWEKNHYPNLRLPTLSPRLTKVIFHGQLVGAMLHNRFNSGMNYNFWISNGQPDPVSGGYPTGFSTSGRIGFDLSSPTLKLDLGFLAANYNDYGNNLQPKGIDLNLSWNNLGLWAEWSGDQTQSGFYSILSYTIPFAKWELIPFWFYDLYKQNIKVDSEVVNTFGINLKPRHDIVFKAEGSIAADANGVLGQKSASLAFVYFFD